MAYLYGASVQGIQGFVFERNELKTIIGASEIIKSLEKYVKNLKNNYSLKKEPTIILNAAGNIRLKIEDKDDAKIIFKYLAKDVIQKAYGITISQAVVEIEEDGDARKTLEKQLKIQRNKVSLPLDMSINILKLAPKNARPSIAKDTSMSTDQKLKMCDKVFKGKKDYEKYKEIKNISNKKNKIAIIHADGNGLGEKVKNYTGDISKFSADLDEATKLAFDKAVNKISKERVKIREVVLGGDDLAVICDADYALEFTKNYLYYFECTTEKTKSVGKLTACAGIAYCHEKYPFHYAIELAEELCSYAKDACERKKSCLMFHNIQGSHFDSYKKFITNELVARGDKKDIYFNFGPYYLECITKPTIDDFQTLFKLFREEDSPLLSLRNWIKELHYNNSHADILLKRINSGIDREKWSADTQLKYLDDNLNMESLVVAKDAKYKTPIYDILQINAATQEALYEV